MQRNIPNMYRLYEALRKRDTPPTVLELQLAHGQNVLTTDATQAYISKLEKKADELVEYMQAALKVRV